MLWLPGVPTCTCAACPAWFACCTFTNGGGMVRPAMARLCADAEAFGAGKFDVEVAEAPPAGGGKGAIVGGGCACGHCCRENREKVGLLGDCEEVEDGVMPSDVEEAAAELGADTDVFGVIGTVMLAAPEFGTGDEEVEVLVAADSVCMRRAALRLARGRMQATRGPHQHPTREHRSLLLNRMVGAAGAMATTIRVPLRSKRAAAAPRESREAKHRGRVTR